MTDPLAPLSTDPNTCIRLPQKGLATLLRLP